MTAEKRFAVGELVTWWDPVSEVKRSGVVRRCDEGTLLTIADVAGDVWRVGVARVTSAASAPTPSSAPVRRFRVGDLVWERYLMKRDGIQFGWRRSVFRAWSPSGYAWLDGLCVPGEQVDEEAVLRFRCYQLGEHIEWFDSMALVWRPAVVIQDSPWMLGLRARRPDGQMMVWIEESTINVRRATLAQDDVDALEASIEDLLIPKVSIPLNALAGDVIDGAYVLVDTVTGGMQAVVAGRDERGVRVTLRTGEHAVLPENEAVHDYHHTRPTFTCPVGCPRTVPTKHKIRLLDSGPVVTLSRLVPLERATHVDVYRCTKCGGMWHRDDLVRRLGSALIQDWAKRHEVGARLKMKLAERKAKKEPQ